MANNAKPNAQSVGTTTQSIYRFVSDVTAIRKGERTFTVNAPNGISINGHRFNKGEKAPVVNAKLFGYSLPVALVTTDDIRAIVTYLRKHDISDVLATVAEATAKGYRHEDRVSALMSLINTGKPFTAETLVGAIESAKAARSTGTTKQAPAEVTDDDIDAMLGAL